MLIYHNKQCHELKVNPAYYIPLACGFKTFEVRVDDRGFKVGDYLWLREHDAVSGSGYSGRDLVKEVTYILKGGEVASLEPGVVVMAIVNPWPIEVAEIKALFAREAL